MGSVRNDLTSTLFLVLATCLSTSAPRAESRGASEVPELPALCIVDSVRTCTELGLMYDPAFMAGAEMELTWTSDRLARIAELIFVENGFEALWVTPERTFESCVRQQLDRARILWPPSGSYRVNVLPVS